MAEIKRDMRKVEINSICDETEATEQTYILKVDDSNMHTICIEGEDTEYKLIKKGDDYIKSPYNEFK